MSQCTKSHAYKITLTIFKVCDVEARTLSKDEILVTWSDELINTRFVNQYNLL